MATDHQRAGTSRWPVYRSLAPPRRTESAPLRAWMIVFVSSSHFIALAARCSPRRPASHAGCARSPQATRPSSPPSAMKSPRGGLALPTTRNSTSRSSIWACTGCVGSWFQRHQRLFQSLGGMFRGSRHRRCPLPPGQHALETPGLRGGLQGEPMRFEDFLERSRPRYGRSWYSLASSKSKTTGTTT